MAQPNADPAEEPRRGALSFFRRTARFTHVTDEHLPIHPDLLGRTLASPWRRAVAFGADVILWFLVVLPWAFVCGMTALYLQAPTAAEYFFVMFDQDVSRARKEALQEGALPELGHLVARHRPELLPREAQEAHEAGNDAEVARILFSESSFNFDMARTEPSYYERSTNTYVLGGDVLFGPLAKVFAPLSSFLLYFTLFGRWMRGRTPGKWLTGIRVVRLDGAPLSFWDCFGRAGGYAASVSTFGLGFLEALWHPNRQTIHDRISGTVVVRWPRRTPRPAPEPEEPEREDAP